MIHPTGKYAYFMVINRNYILRSDFNGEIFTAPYVIAGLNSAKDTYVYQDGSVIRLGLVIPTLVYL